MKHHLRATSLRLYEYLGSDNAQLYRAAFEARTASNNFQVSYGRTAIDISRSSRRGLTRHLSLTCHLVVARSFLFYQEFYAEHRCICIAYRRFLLRFSQEPNDVHWVGAFSIFLRRCSLNARDRIGLSVL